MTHQGTFDRLLGKKQPPYMRDQYSLNNKVTPTTPPTILLLSNNDRTVPPISSIRYYQALKYNGVKAAMHVYPEGGHGWVGREGFRYEKDWQHQLKRWMEYINKK
jgi:dipeptidyl aminopeptidase/acylaminoacyl peptidase